MSQITLATTNTTDLQLLLALAQRLNVKIVDINHNVQLVETAVSSKEIQSLLDSTSALDFLNREEEDLYSDEDLKKVY